MYPLFFKVNNGIKKQKLVEVKHKKPENGKKLIDNEDGKN